MNIINDYDELIERLFKGEKIIVNNEKYRPHPNLIVKVNGSCDEITIKNGATLNKYSDLNGNTIEVVGLDYGDNHPDIQYIYYDSRYQRIIAHLSNGQEKNLFSDCLMLKRNSFLTEN